MPQKPPPEVKVEEEEEGESALQRVIASGLLSQDSGDDDAVSDILDHHLDLEVANMMRQVWGGRGCRV